MRETASFLAMKPITAFARPRLPSEFSKSIGFTLCGIVEEPISPFTVRCLKYPIDTYIHTSLSKSRSTEFQRHTASKISAIPSWLSICVVRRFCLRPSDSMTLRESLSQSTFGYAERCALKFPTAPFIFAGITSLSISAAWRRSRAETTASSLPTVVGEAGCPCVCASIGTFAHAFAISATFAVASSIAARSTFLPSRSISACDMLLMSSLVQAKWTNSSVFAPFAPNAGASFSLRKYSTALTSWFVVLSMSFTRCASASENSAATRSTALACADVRRHSATPLSAASALSHVHSTRTRRLTSPYSEKTSCSSEHLFAYRPSIGLTAIRLSKFIVPLLYQNPRRFGVRRTLSSAPARRGAATRT